MQTKRRGHDPGVFYLARQKKGTACWATDERGQTRGWLQQYYWEGLYLSII